MNQSKMKQLFMLSALAAFLITGCSDDKSDPNARRSETDRAIGIRGSFRYLDQRQYL